VIELRLSHPIIDFWVDVLLRQFENPSIAVADLASTPEIAVPHRPDLAVLLALWPDGPSLAGRLAARLTLTALNVPTSGDHRAGQP
jgi:hypothetical protein